MKNIYGIIILLIFTSTLYGQKDSFQARLDNLRAQKIAYITQRVELTPKEAEVFWPVYNELAIKKEDINKRRRKIIFELKNNWDNYSDNEKEALADEYINLKLEEAQLEVEYNDKFKQVLSIDKLLKLYQAETSFKNYLLNKIRHQNAKGAQRPYQRPE